MDEKIPPTGQFPYEAPGPVAGMKDRISEKLSEFGRDAANKLDDTREGAAGALDSTASSLQTGKNRLSSAARSAADSLKSTAEYVRRTNVQGMVEDVQGIVKRYPGQSLAAAAILGFIVARGFRSRHD